MPASNLPATATTPPPPPQLEAPLVRRRLRALMLASHPVDLPKALLHECLKRDLHAPALALLHTESALEWHISRTPDALMACRYDEDESTDLYYLTNAGLNKARAESRP